MIPQSRRAQSSVKSYPAQRWDPYFAAAVRLSPNRLQIQCPPCSKTGSLLQSETGPEWGTAAITQPHIGPDGAGYLPGQPCNRGRWQESQGTHGSSNSDTYRGILALQIMIPERGLSPKNLGVPRFMLCKAQLLQPRSSTLQPHPQTPRTFQEGGSGHLLHAL